MPVQPCVSSEAGFCASHRWGGGPLAAKELAHACPDKDPTLIARLAASGGECLGHNYYNDTGPGARCAGVACPYKQRLEELGLLYLYGDEGLEDGKHAGEDLWHMVRCTCKKKHSLHVCACSYGKHRPCAVLLCVDR